MSSGGHHREQHSMLVHDAAGRFDYVGAGKAGYDVGGYELILEHLRRIEPDVEFAIFRADRFDSVNSSNPVQARYQVVTCEIGKLGQSSIRRAQTNVDYREGAGGQQ